MHIYTYAYTHADPRTHTLTQRTHTHEQVQGLADHPNQWFRVSVQYHKAKSGVCPDANAHPVTRPTHGESLPQMRNNVDLTIARPDETDIMTATIFESAKNNNNIQVNTDMSLQKRGRDWEGEDNEPATDNAELT